MPRPAILVHAGAQSIRPAEREGFERASRQAAAVGYAILANGGNAVEAVVAAVKVLEDDPHPNAGLGSVLNADGIPETDALVMEGLNLQIGGVAALVGVRNPIELAALLLKEPRLNLLAGEGARRYAAEHGVALGAPGLLITERQRKRFERLSAATADTVGDGADTVGNGADTVGDSADTVGAVAVDHHGLTAAAVSTGGIALKHPGRVGDSPLVGSGAYADKWLGAAVATGVGEDIMRVLLAYITLDALARGQTASQATAASIATLQQRVSGLGGVILMTPTGEPAAAYNTESMPHAWMHAELAEPQYAD